MAPYQPSLRWQMVGVRVNDGQLPDLQKHYLSNHRDGAEVLLDAANDRRGERMS